MTSVGIDGEPQRGDEHAALRAEVVRDERHVHACVGGDRAHGRAVVAAGAELAPGRVEDLLLRLPSVGPRTALFHQRLKYSARL